MSRAAYVVFGENGYPLDKNTVKLGLWVYNDHINSNWLGAWVIDAKGTRHQVYFTRAMNWTGWKYLTASLEGIELPARLARVYLVQVNPTPDSGSIYIDDLNAITAKYPVIDRNSVPSDTRPADEANRAVTYKQGKNSFRFAVFDQRREPVTETEKYLVKHFTTKVNKYVEGGAVVGVSSHQFAKDIKKPFAATGTGYKSFDIKNSRFIQLDTSKKGLRLSNPDQWQWFMDQLNSFSGSNVFIFMDIPPKDFSDSLEAGLFQDILTEYRQKTGKNVWVFYSGSENRGYMEREIRYLSVSGMNGGEITEKNKLDLKYILVVVQGSEVTYQVKPIF